MPTGMARPHKSVFSNRNFMLLFSGQLISQVGDSMYQIGLLWLVLDLTGSKSTMGFVATIAYLPMLVFGVLAGILADTFDRRKLMLVSDALRFLAVLVLPFALFQEVLTVPIILAVTFAITTFSTPFNPARDSIIPDLVGGAELVKANSLIQSTHFSAMLLGPALAAAVLAMVGLAHLFTIDSLTFLLSFLTIFLIRNLAANTTDRRKLDLAGHFSEIVRFVHRDKKLRFLLGLTAINNFFIMGPAIAGTPIFVKEFLRGSAADYAFAESCLGLGMLAGSVLVNYSARFVGKGKLLLLGIMFDGLTFLLIFWCRSLALFLVLVGIHGIGIPHIVVMRTSLIQEWIDSRQLGRVFSLVNMSVVGMTAVTVGVTGWLAEFVAINHLFAIFGLSGMFCGMVGWLHRELRTS